MDGFDTKVERSNTYWWITSLAISVVCCAILFVIFAGYLFQVKGDLAVTKVRSDIVESRVNEMALEIQILNRRSTVQQIQIIPSNGAQAKPATETPDAEAAAAAAAAAAAGVGSGPALTQPAAQPPAPAKH